jgi:short-chain fatty acids transporter
MLAAVIARLSNALVRAASRWVPDPFVIALGLTALVAAVSAVRLIAVGDGPGDVATALSLGWVRGFSNPAGLAFALQMCLVLVTGHAMAESPPVQRMVARLATWPTSAASATGLVAAVACLAAMIHWGLAAIVGAFLAREIARHAPARGLRLHYPILGAAAYAGMAVWHGGLSGSAPLKMAEAGNAVVGVLPLSETLLSPLNLLVSGGLCVAIPLLFVWMTPRAADDQVPAGTLEALPERRVASERGGAVAWLETSPLVGRSLGLAGLVAVVVGARRGALAFDLNAVNLCFLCAGLALQGGLLHYVDAIASGARGAGAIILQFPFYFALVGVMQAGGLIAWLSGGLAALSSSGSFPLVAFHSAGLVNLAIPSGGGQWAVQGDILLAAGKSLGVDPRVTVMAFSYGDAWTNMLQPFWALPLLGITGLRARDIFGYTVMVALLVWLVVSAALLIV